MSMKIRRFIRKRRRRFWKKARQAYVTAVQRDVESRRASGRV